MLPLFQTEQVLFRKENNTRYFVGLLTRISRCGQPHPRIWFAFPVRPLQPASDLLSQKKQTLYAHSYRIRDYIRFPETCLGVSPNSLVQRNIPACLPKKNAPVPQKSEHYIRLVTIIKNICSKSSENG